MNVFKHTKLLFFLILFVLIGCQEKKESTVDIDTELLTVTALNDSSNTIMSQYLAPYRTKKNELMQVVIGTAASDMSTGQPEGLLNNLLADILLQYANSVEPTDFSLSNLGGVRRNLSQGDITLGDIYEILPFDNTLILLRFPGLKIQEIADVIAEKGGAVTSGISFGIKNGKAEHVLINGEPLDVNKEYTLVTNDYLSYGNDYYTPLVDADERVLLQSNMRDITIDYIKNETAAGKAITSTLKQEIYVEK